MIDSNEICVVNVLRANDDNGTFFVPNSYFGSEYDMIEKLSKEYHFDFCCGENENEFSLYKFKYSQIRSKISIYLFAEIDKYYKIYLYKAYYDNNLVKYNKYVITLDCSYFSYEQSLRYFFENIDKFIIE